MEIDEKNIACGWDLSVKVVKSEREVNAALVNIDLYEQSCPGDLSYFAGIVTGEVAADL